MRRHWKWAICLGLLLGALLLRWALWYITGVDVQLRPLQAAVVVAALLVSPNAGMAIAIAGSIVSYLLMTRQSGTALRLDTGALIDILIFVVVAWAICLLIGWMKHRRWGLAGPGTQPLHPAEVASLAGPVATLTPVYTAKGEIDTFRLASIEVSSSGDTDPVPPAWQQAVGQTIDALWPNWRAAGIYEKLCQTLATARPSQFELALPGSSSDPLIYRLRSARLHDQLLVSWRDITTDRDVQQKLRINEWRYRSLIQATSAIVWSVPASGEFESDQPEWAAFTGQRYEDYRGWGWIKAVHPEDRDRAVLAWSAALAKKTLYHVEYRLRNREGDYRHMSARAVPIIGDDGQVLEWLGVHTDITDRRRAEQVVVSSERHLRRVLNNLFAFVGVLTTDGTLISANNAPLQAAGIGPEEVLGRKFWDCYWWSYAPQIQEQIRSSVDKACRGESSRYDVDVRMAGGVLVTIDFMIAPMRDENGRITHLVPSGVDVSDRKRVEARLADGERFYRQLIEGLPQIVWTCLPDGTCDFVSGRWFDYTGQARENCLSFNNMDLIHPEDRDPAFAAWRAAATSESPLHTEMRVRRHDGVYRWFDVYAVPVYDGDGKVVKWSGSSMDIEDRKQAEEALKCSEARLRTVNTTLEKRVRERTAEVEARSDQLRALALDLAETESRERKRLAQVLHDHFQQLISAAKLKAGIIRRKVENEDTAAALRQVEDLLNEAISASRSLATELSPPVLHDGGLIPALEWLARRMERDHALRVAVCVGTECEPDNEQVRIILFECVRELLFNIRKHAGVDQAHVLVELLPEGLLHIQVSDTGKGFEPIREERRRRSEATFGLFSIRERLSLIGGLMRISSVPGNGTRVDLTVPCIARKPKAAPAKAPEQAADQPMEITPSARLRVLVADDHELFREGLVGMLTQESYVEIVGQAADGEEAVNLARRLKPDLLIVDVSMPRMNGVQVTALLSREMPGLRIVGLSMHEQEDMAQAMREAGAMAYCAKSAAADETLLAVLRQARQSAQDRNVST